MIGKRGRSRSASSRESSAMSRSVTPSGRRGVFTPAQRNAVLAAGAALARTGGRLPANMGELKNIDTTLGFPAVGTSTGVVTLLNGTTQGTTALTRLGRRCTFKSLYVRGFIQMAPTSTGATPIRILVVQDKQANAVAPVATDILNVDGIAGVNNLSNSRRFVTLMDHTIDCVGTQGPQATLVNLYKKLGVVTEYNAGSAGTIGDIQSNSIYALIYTTTGVGVAALSQGLQCRVRFSDN